MFGVGEQRLSRWDFLASFLLQSGTDWILSVAILIPTSQTTGGKYH
jgi:hypothetical protein